MVDNLFLSLKEINQEIVEMYGIVDKIVDYEGEQRDSYVKLQVEIVAAYVRRALEYRQQGIFLSDAAVDMTLLCVGVEKFLAACVVHRDWEEFWKCYKKNRGAINFSYLKSRVLDELTGKLSDEQHERIADVLEHLRIQRNNFIHSNPRGMLHYVIEKQVLLLIVVLSYHFVVPLPASLRDKILEVLEEDSLRAGMRLRNVGFYEQRELFAKELSQVKDPASSDR